MIAAITRALADAQVDPTRVVHVNAHATSTPEGDAVEAQALAKALGCRSTAWSSRPPSR